MYQQKLKDARTLIDQHNSASSGKINPDAFFTKLIEAGGTNDAALVQCTWEDLGEFGLPKLLARQVAQVFRAKSREEKPILKKSRVESMSIEDLVSHYDPNNVMGLVYDRLFDILGNRRFIVFNPDSTVNKEVTTKLAKELSSNYPERELYVLNNEPTSVYKLGERPDQLFDENPLYPGRILRPDGDCDQTNRSWDGVPLEVRQIIRLAISTKELIVNSLNDAHNVLDLVLREDALVVIVRRFPKAFTQLREMQKQGTAPSLKKVAKSPEKKNDPFGTHKTY